MQRNVSKKRSVNKFRIIVAIVITIAVIAFIMAMAALVKKIRHEFEGMVNQPPMTRVITALDSMVIRPSYLARVKPVVNLNYTYRSPVSCLLVDSSYALIIYPIDSAADLPLPGLLEVGDEVVSHSSIGPYNRAGGSIFSFLTWKTRRPSRFNKLFVGMDGDSVRHLVANDSMMSYHGYFKEVSISYAAHASADVYIERQSFPLMMMATPADIAFLRKRGRLFMLVLTQRSFRRVPAGMLEDIVK